MRGGYNPREAKKDARTAKRAARVSAMKNGYPALRRAFPAFTHTQSSLILCIHLAHLMPGFPVTVKGS